MRKLFLGFTEKGEKCSECNGLLKAGQLAIFEKQGIDKITGIPLFCMDCAKEKFKQDKDCKGLLDIVEEREIFSSIDLIRKRIFRTPHEETP